MASRKLPESPDPHSYDGIATDALRNIFPKKWLYKSPRDVFSGREYGEDWVIEIVEADGSVTGIEFSVQNKVNPKVRKRYVVVEGVKVSSLRRLIEISRPTLLHAYDARTATSYWLWLHDWLLENDTSIWSKKPEIDIRIPKKNILDKQAAARITDELRWGHRRQRTETIARLLSEKYKNDYEIRVFSDNNSITTIIDAKRDQAIPYIVPQDQQIYEAIMHVFENGEPVFVSNISRGAFELYFSQDLSLIHDGSSVQLEHVLFFPVPQEDSIPLKVEYLNEHSEILYQTDFVMMNLVNPGTVVRRWQGKPDNEPIIYTLSTNRNQQTTELSVRLLPVSTQKADDLLMRLAICNPQKPVRKYRIHNIQTGETQQFDTSGFTFQISPEVYYAYCDLFNKIILIEHQMGIDVPVDMQLLKDEDINNADLILKVLSQGWLSVDVEQIVPADLLSNFCLIGVDTVRKAREIMTGFEEHKSIHLYITNSSNISRELCGQKINLGNARYEFLNSTIINPEALRDYLSKESLSEDEQVQIPFAIDQELVRLKFLEWPRTAHG